MKDISLAVKEVVLFIYQTGNLTNEFVLQNSMYEGTLAHNHLQSLYKADDKKEYHVKKTFELNNYQITINGFIDGVLSRYTLEEIKSTHKNLEEIEISFKPEHLAQLKMYAYLYMDENDLESVKIKLTYVKIPNYETKSFEEEITFKEASDFFFETINEYISWIDKINKHSISLLESVKIMEFPFPNYRLYQKKLMKECYNNILNKSTLFAIAPTGVGKTISTIFSTLKALSNEREKIFYLTAKTSGKKVAIETINLLRNKNADIKAIELTAKEKICIHNEFNCDPNLCPFANNYYTKLKNALYDGYNNYDVFSTDIIKELAKKHQICPFELQLDLSNYMDMIIGDYNYAFDPRTHLIRYFDTNDYENILLIDEAHNMITRSRDMYSSTFNYLELDDLKRYLSKVKPSIKKSIKEFQNNILNYSDDYYYTDFLIDELISPIRKIAHLAEDALNENPELPNHKEALEIYFNLKGFVKISDFFDEDFRFIINKNEIEIRCLDASNKILETLNNHTVSSIFFSATMHPIEYYQKFITKGLGEAITIPSPFNPHNLSIMIPKYANTKYNYRGESISDIISTIEAMISYKTGNYIVFFPSYEYLNLVVSELDNPNYLYIIQTPTMSEAERHAIIEEFKDSSYTKVGFFVMGGAFSEGIDYIGDMLSGVLIVSVCLPMFGSYNNMLKEHFDKNGLDGMNYAYQIPGMSKVIQAVGRLIRSENDKGIAILYDERFNYTVYKKLMPPSWVDIKSYYSNNDLKNLIKKAK